MGDMLFNSFKIMQQSITRQALRYQPPDILIKPESPGCVWRISIVLTRY